MKRTNGYVAPSEDANVVGNIAIVFLSILLVCLGLVMTLTKAVKIVYFCYGAGACLLVWGIWMISRYFLRKEFQHTTNYGFSVGTLVVILGSIDLIRAKEIAETIPNYLGIMVLIEGVVMLQNTVQLKNLGGKTWITSLVFSLLCVAASIVILLNVGHIISKHSIVLYIILIFAGGFALLSLCFVGICTKRFHKTMGREVERNMQEACEFIDTQDTVEVVEVSEDEVSATEQVEDDDPLV